MLCAQSVCPFSIFFVAAFTAAKSGIVNGCTVLGERQHPHDPRLYLTCHHRLVAALAPIVANLIPRKPVPETVLLLVGGAVLGPSMVNVIWLDESVQLLSDWMRYALPARRLRNQPQDHHGTRRKTRACHLGSYAWACLYCRARVHRRLRAGHGRPRRHHCAHHDRHRRAYAHPERTRPAGNAHRKLHSLLRHLG